MSRWDEKRKGYMKNGQQFNLQKRRGAALRSLLMYNLLSVLQKL